MYDNVSSINAGSLDMFDSIMDFDDLAFWNLVMCMKESDAALSRKMQEIRLSNQHKKDITAEIDRLQDALEDGSGDPVYVEGGFSCEEFDKYPPDPELADLSDQELFERYLGGAITGDASEEDMKNMEAELGRRGYVSKERVEERIEDLRTELETMNTDSNVQMIDLNRLISKRSEVIQLTSNIISKCHRTAMEVIANFK